MPLTNLSITAYSNSIISEFALDLYYRHISDSIIISRYTAAQCRLAYINTYNVADQSYSPPLVLPY